MQHKDKCDQRWKKLHAWNNNYYYKTAMSSMLKRNSHCALRSQTIQACLQHPNTHSHSVTHAQRFIPLSICQQQRHFLTGGLPGHPVLHAYCSCNGWIRKLQCIMQVLQENNSHKRINVQMSQPNLDLGDPVLYGFSRPVVQYQLSTQCNTG